MQPPKIFYFCFSHDRPTGGNKKIYHHVDILNRAGFEAYVVHFTDKFRITWFKNETLVVNRSQFQRIYQGDRDILVLPEDLGNKILSFPGKKVIFNQNIFHGFRVLSRSKTARIPYLDESVIGAIAVSSHNREILRLSYPNLPIFRVYCGIDRDTFQFSKLSQKRKQIAANPHKNDPEILSAYQMLRSRSLQGLNSLQNWDWVWIEEKSEIDVAKILRESAIFVSLSLQEGFGILPLEAMASGCLVVAYGVEPMTEYLPPEVQLPPGDLKGIVDRIEAWGASFSEDSRDLQKLCDRSLEIAKTYSLQREADSVVSAWKSLLNQKVWF